MTEARPSVVTIRSAEGVWRASSVPGVSIKELRTDRGSGGSSALIRFDAGVRFPAHDHPGGEEVFVLEGTVDIGGRRLAAGDYLYTPPGGRHAAPTEGGCLFLVVLPKPIEMIDS